MQAAPAVQEEMPMQNKRSLYIRAVNVIVILLALLYYNQMLGMNQQLEKANETIASLSAGGSQTASAQAGGKYKDGKYQGSAQGFGGTVTVEVTIEEGYISDIQVVSADGEDAAYYNMAIDVLDSIIADQSSDVDVVSGATYTSNGIIGAAKEALGKAGDAE